MKALVKPEGSFISYFSNLVKQYGGVNLAQGIPGFDPPRLLVEELKKISVGNFHQYAPGVGNFELRNLLKKHFGLSDDNLLVVQGATEGLSLIYTYLLRKLNGNFSVLSFDPAYESYSKLPEIFGQRFIPFHFGDDGHVNFQELEKTVTNQNVKLIFVSSPGNPFGNVWSKNDIVALVNLANKLDFYLVFDAVYQDLYFYEKPYIPVDLLSDRLFIVSSFSKSLCITGWRVGYILHHDSHCTGLRAIHDYIGLCAPSLLQQALAGYLEKSNFAADFTADLREKVLKSFSLLSNTLLKKGFTIPKIDGGCFIWAKLPDGWTDGFNFAAELYTKRKVAVIPGEHFSKEKQNWIRLNIARPISEIEQACYEINDFIK